jgi:hypothetical protein
MRESILTSLQCNSYYGVHDNLTLSVEEEVALSNLLWAYKSGAENAGDWTAWIHESLNEGSTNPRKGPGLSIEAVLGWSPIRISIVVLTPVILSLVIGIWFQSRNPTDLVTVQTAGELLLISLLLALVSFGFSTSVLRERYGSQFGREDLLTSESTVVAGLLAVLSGIGNK